MTKRILLLVVVVVVAGLIIAYFTRNYLVKRAIEKGGDYALGVQTVVGSVNLGIGAGRLEMKDLEVRNPEGFDGKDILSIKNADFDVETGSIFGNEVVVDSFVLDGLTVNLQQIDNRGNFSEILGHIKKLDLSSSSESQQRFRIKRLVMRDIGASASLILLGKKQAEQSFTIDNFTLKDVGGDKGATIGRLTAIVLHNVLTRAVAAGKKNLPGGFGDLVNSGVKENLQKLESEAKDKLKDLGKGLIGNDK